MMPDMWGPPSAAEISAAENENARLSKRVKELEAQNAELLTKVEQLQAERDAAVVCIGKLTVILKKYPYAATNGCAYEAYMEIKKYIEAVRGVQEEDGNEAT